MKTWKQYLPDVLVILLFAAISFAYFFPADIEGKILFRHDSAASKGLGRELSEHREKTGEQTRWMNSVFSGMRHIRRRLRTAAPTDWARS